MTVSRSYPAGVPCWIDIEHRDVEGARAFYGGLFGWTFEDATSPGDPATSLIARLDGHEVAGLVGAAGHGTGRPAPAAWNTYVAVTDADEVSARVADAGGRVVQVSTTTHRTDGTPPSATRSAYHCVSGRPVSAPAPNWSTRPEPGTSATCTPTTRRRPGRSTPTCSAGRSRTSASPP